MAYDDTKWGGFAKIIVDTSTMTAGDTVRVRSLTDANAIYDKTVVTAGTPLLFETEIFKDYVKICTVQEIGGVATEIGGVYRTVDYGQTLFIDVLDKTTLGGIQGILNAHQETELLSIGDETTITVNGNPWIMQVAGINLYDSHEVIFASKYIYGRSIMGDGYYYNTGSQELKSAMQSFYNAIAEKAFIKNSSRCCRTSGSGTPTFNSYNDYVYAPNYYEITGNAASSGTPPISLRQYPIFTTQANRVKSFEGEAAEAWWSCDGTGSSPNFFAIDNTGSQQQTNRTNSKGMIPCFRLTADA